MRPLNTKAKPLSSKRLSRAGRRSQLLRVSKEILEADGADALTLGVLAARAGVSKPVAYDHFETRAGLLIAMLEDTSRYYESNARTQIEAAPQSLVDTAKILSEIYVACTLEAGPHVSKLLAAVEANADAHEVGRLFCAGHAEQLRQAFDPLVIDENGELPLLFTGLIAAADAICAEMTAGRISPDAAADALTHLLTTSLSPFERAKI